MRSSGKSHLFLSVFVAGLAWLINGELSIDFPEHQPVYAQEGTDLNLGCLAEGDPCAVIDWYHDDNLLDTEFADSDSQLSWLEQVVHEEDTCFVYSELIKGQLAQEDAGIYTCTDRYGAGTYSLLVFIVSITPVGGEMRLGESARIGCQVSDNVSRNPYSSPMRWLHHGEPIYIDNRKYVTDPSDDSFLIINHTRLEDAGEYRCVFKLPNEVEYSQTVNLVASSY